MQAPSQDPEPAAAAGTSPAPSAEVEPEPAPSAEDAPQPEPTPQPTTQASPEPAEAAAQSEPSDTDRRIAVEKADALIQRGLEVFNRGQPEQVRQCLERYPTRAPSEASPDRQLPSWLMSANCLIMWILCSVVQRP